MKAEWYLTAAPDFSWEGAVGILPVASCEQHARHLPVGTDGLIGWRLAQAAAARASAAAVILPLQQIGYSPHHRAFAGYLTLSQDVMRRYLTEICLCAFQNGLERLLILNSHGGNQSCLQTVVNELGAVYGKKAIVARYWDLIAGVVRENRSSGPGGMGHAGEFETSLMEYLYPELVRRDRIEDMPPAEGTPYHNPDMFAGNRIYQYKPFDEYSEQGNVGQPQFASAEKGKLFFQSAAAELAKLIDYFAKHSF